MVPSTNSLSYLSSYQGDKRVLVQSGSLDEKWIQRVEQIILKNLVNSQFTIHSLADLVHCSERQLYRQLNKLTGFTPLQFIREIRLHLARVYLENHHYRTVKEISYAVGFKDPVYFSRLFIQRFGMYPASFL